jgi:hypothetical protein
LDNTGTSTAKAIPLLAQVIICNKIEIKIDKYENTM